MYEGRVIKLTKDAKKWLPIEGSRVSVTMKRNKRKEKFMATVSVVRSASLLKKKPLAAQKSPDLLSLRWQ